MTDKQQYYGLDEIGFVGAQSKKTNVQIKKDIERTIQLIKDRKSDMVFPCLKKCKTALNAR